MPSDKSIGVAPWEAMHLYKVGDQRCWLSVHLVCTRRHYAGDAAEHPWDPGDGWTPEKASTLWTPNGEEEAKKLSALLAERTRGVGPDRLYHVIDRAIG
jgi:hypothetical protein